MNYDKKTIRDIDVSGKKILLRCDFNVPHDKTTGIIHDDTRIVSTLPTIRYLLEHNAAVILLSHMGREELHVRKRGPRRGKSRGGLDKVRSRLRHQAAHDFLLLVGQKAGLYDDL